MVEPLEPSVSGSERTGPWKSSLALSVSKALAGQRALLEGAEETYLLGFGPLLLGDIDFELRRGDTV